MKKRSGFIIALGVFVLIILFSSFSAIINFVIDYMWFKELGYTKTFLIKLSTQFKVGIPVFIILLFIINFYLISIKRSFLKKTNTIFPKDWDKRANKILTVVSILVSFFISSIITGNLWFDILQYFNSTDFNVKDPIFDKDLSFYIFKLPLFDNITDLLLLFIVIIIIMTVAFYLIMISFSKFYGGDSLDFESDNRYRGLFGDLFKNKMFKTAITQIGIIGFIVFVVIGINHLLKSYYLLYSPRGRVFGAGFTDIHVILWIYRILAVTSLLSGVGFFLGLTKRKTKTILLGPIIMILISIVGNVTAGIVEKIIVEPDQISKELPYLKHNIDYTQRAYGLENVLIEEFPATQDLTREDVLENSETIKNIRINDYRPLKETYNQLQGIRPYYWFNDIDIDRYNINGEYTQVFLSARELNMERLDPQARNWINEHLKYTHGYGFTLSPVNSVTTEGQPILLVKDIPPRTETNLKIEKPEIYFGELTNNYIIVNTDEMEIDYPQGSTNKETIYNGKAGIKLGFLNKLLFAVKEGDLKLLISNNINPDSKIIINRNINERVRKIAPFIQYDDDPYLVINQEDGKLYWIIDGYTLSSRYPYSQPYKDTGINYIRNSVKVVIDAYNGDTKFYISDKNDPIIITYSKIFDDLFLSIDDMPKGIKEHIRYPQQLFDIQSEIYRTYHMDNPEMFFTREDFWDIAKEIYMEQEQNVESNYVMFKLPDEEKAEFLLTVPFTPNGKNNMTALLVARNDGENYGKLILYRLPKSENIPGPMMIETRIDQDSTISPQLTLWSQKGSIVLRGNLLVIPVEQSLLYVEPIYLKADNENSLPEVKRIIVAYKDKIVMEETLDEALSKIFGDVQKENDDNKIIDDIEVKDLDGNVKEIIRRANETFNNAKKASQEGNWAKYGEYLKELEDILNQLNDKVIPENNQ